MAGVGGFGAGVVLVERRAFVTGSAEVIGCFGAFDRTTLTLTVREQQCNRGVGAPTNAICTLPELPNGCYALPGGDVLVLPNDGGMIRCE